MRKMNSNNSGVSSTATANACYKTAILCGAIDDLSNHPIGEIVFNLPFDMPIDACVKSYGSATDAEWITRKVNSANDREGIGSNLKSFLSMPKDEFSFAARNQGMCKNKVGAFIITMDYISPVYARRYLDELRKTNRIAYDEIFQDLVKWNCDLFKLDAFAWSPHAHYLANSQTQKNRYDFIKSLTYLTLA